MNVKFLEDNGVRQMAHKGPIQKGADAEITVFDFESITDNSKMKDDGLRSTDIPYMVVNGTVVVKDSEVLKDAFPGKPIRCSGTVR